MITLRHFDYMAKIMLVTGTMVGYAYSMEFFIAWYSGNPYEMFAFLNRAFGPYAWAYWIMITCNVISPQFFWFKKARTSIPILFVASIVDQHRHVVRAVRHHRDVAAPRLPPVGLGLLHPDHWDVACLLGSFGLFFTMFCLFVRFLPMVATAEVKTVLPQADPHFEPGPEREVHAVHAPVVVPSGSQAGSRWSLSSLLLNRLPKGPHYGVLAMFATPAELDHACERVRDAGSRAGTPTRRFPSTASTGPWGCDAHTLPWIVLGMGLTGAALGFILQVWVHGVAYPLVISGKPYFSWPAFIPVTFEVSVLFAALGAVVGMLGLNRLPMHHHPLFRFKVFERVTDDAFFISIESWDPGSIRRPPEVCWSRWAHEASSRWSPE